MIKRIETYSVIGFGRPSKDDLVLAQKEANYNDVAVKITYRPNKYAGAYEVLVDKETDIEKLYNKLRNTIYGM